MLKIGRMRMLSFCFLLHCAFGPCGDQNLQYMPGHSQLGKSSLLRATVHVVMMSSSSSSVMTSSSPSSSTSPLPLSALSQFAAHLTHFFLSSSFATVCGLLGHTGIASTSLSFYMYNAHSGIELMSSSSSTSSPSYTYNMYNAVALAPRAPPMATLHALSDAADTALIRRLPPTDRPHSLLAFLRGAFQFAACLFDGENRGFFLTLK